MHEQADDDTEHDGADGAGDADLQAENTGGEDDGEDIDGRSGVEKGGGGSQAGAHLVDAGKERQDGTGADGQDRSGDGSDAIGEHLVGAGAEVLHNGGLADKNGDGPGDEESRHQAEQDVLTGVPFDQVQGFVDGPVEAGDADR